MPRRWLRARGVSRPAAIRSSAWISTVHIGLAMVDDGQAFADRRFLEGCDAGEYLDAEVRASRRRHGLWQLPGGITRPGSSGGHCGHAIPGPQTPGGAPGWGASLFRAGRAVVPEHQRPSPLR